MDKVTNIEVLGRTNKDLVITDIIKAKLYYLGYITQDRGIPC